MVKHRNILRAGVLAGYILVTLFLVYGISALYSYLNTGADRSKMLHTELKKIDQYLPEITWAPLRNKGREMDEQTLAQIENDYLDAWYVRHIAYKTNQKAGIEDYYTESARENIYSYIKQNKLEKITIDGTTLEHHLHLDFFSEDGQLVVLTDKNVLEYKRIYNDKDLALETYEVANYKMILLLEDGFWRIRHFIREAVKTKKDFHLKKIDSTFIVKGINYYPQNSPWDMYGEQFSKDTIATDFKIIKEANLNTIRIFVPYEDFGKANVNGEKLQKLHQVLDIANDNGLKVIVTLFDFFGDYSVINWTLNQKHAIGVVSSIKEHPALLAWDIKNEPDLDFDSRGKVRVTSWLKRITVLVKSLDKKHPVTIGWSNAESADVLKDDMDFISFHYYKKPIDFKKAYDLLHQKVASKQIMVTEFGLSSYSGFWNLYTGSEEKQEAYYKNMQQQFKKDSISFMSWTLYDFTKIPKEVVGQLPWRRNAQKHFGFINKIGKKKKSFNYISSD